MMMDFNIDSGTVHLWRVFLPNFSPDKALLWNLLSQDEQDRANQLYLPLHQERFILTRGLLRKTLSFYTKAPITFQYGTHGKPSIATPLMFNISHSEDMAIFALTWDKPIGVDIQIMSSSFKNNVAERVFNKNENEELKSFPDQKKIEAFYKLWSRKEAILKAFGEGLFTSFEDFTVSAKPLTQTLCLQNIPYIVQHINAHPNYQSALATPAPLEKIMGWEWTQEGPINFHEMDFTFT